MPQSPNVIVTVGSGPSPKLPRQDYENIVTKYNIGPLESNGSFFNKSVSEGASSDAATRDSTIYGFFSGNTSFTNKTSLQKIVSFFQQSDLIDVVICDFVVKQNGFDSYLYTHPLTTVDIPFFIHARAVQHINFPNNPFIFQTQIQIMRTIKCPIFHIAQPLLTLDNSL